jgi:hypothetical protein
MASSIQAVGMQAEALTPFAYHSFAVPSGTATAAGLVGDRAMGFALASALGLLRASPVMPRRDYAGHMARLPWLASVFEAKEAALLRPLVCRLNLDTEGGYSKRIADATGSGNLKTYFTIQEAAPGTVFQGAVFGVNPFAMASDILGEPVTEIVVRVGLRRAGLLLLTPAMPETIRLNAATAHLFGVDLPAAAPDGRVDRYVLHELQLTAPLAVTRAAELVAGWRSFSGLGNAP